MDLLASSKLSFHLLYHTGFSSATVSPFRCSGLVTAQHHQTWTRPHTTISCTKPAPSTLSTWSSCKRALFPTSLFSSVLITNNLANRQWFSLMAIRTRRLSIFQHPPAFNELTQNLWLFPAIVFALLIAIFWLYVPAFQTTLLTSPVPVEFWILPMAFGIGLLCLDEARKAAARRWPQGFIARIAW